MPYTEEQRRVIVKNLGQNPDAFDYDEISRKLIPRQRASTGSQPVQTLTVTPPPKPSVVAKPPITGFQSLGISTLGGVAPSTAGALAGFGGTALAAMKTSNPWLLLGSGLASAVAGSDVTARAQDKVLPQGARDLMAESYRQHPYISAIGSTISGLPTMRFSPGAVKEGIKGLVGLVTPGLKATKPQLMNLAGTGIGATLPIAQQFAQSRATGEPMQWGPSVFGAGLGAGVLNAPAPFVRRTFNLPAPAANPQDQAFARFPRDLASRSQPMAKPVDTENPVFQLEDVPSTELQAPKQETRGLTEAEQKIEAERLAKTNEDLVKIEKEPELLVQEEPTTTTDEESVAKQIRAEELHTKIYDNATTESERDQALAELQGLASESKETANMATPKGTGDTANKPPVTQPLYDFFSALGKDIRNYDLTTGEPKLPTGEPAYGESNYDTSTGESRITIDPTAPGEVLPHEAGHQLLASLRSSPNKADRALVDSFLKQVEGSDTYKIFAERWAKDGRSLTPEEFLALKAGKDALNRLYNNDTRLTTAWSDFKAGLKYKLGIATPDELASLLGNKLYFDPSYSEQGLKPSGSKGGVTSANATPEDVARYNQVQESIRGLIKSGQGIESPEIQSLWKESEAIKNKYNGEVPKSEDTQHMTPGDESQITTSRALNEEEQTSKESYGFSPVTTASYDRLRNLGPHGNKLADALVNQAAQARKYRGEFVFQPLNNAVKLPQSDIVGAAEFARAKFRGETPDHPLTPGEQIAFDQVIKPASLLPRLEQNRTGLEVQLGGGASRAGSVSDYHWYDMPSEQTFHDFLENPNAPKAQRIVNEWASYMVEKSTAKSHPLTLDQAKDIAENYFNAASGSKLYSADFNAMTRAEGLGVPESLREKNPIRVIQRAGNRAANALSIWTELQSKPEIAGLLQMKMPDGTIAPKIPGVTPIEGNSDVVNAMQWVYRDFRPPSKWTSFNHMLHSTFLGAGSALTDIATTPSFAAPYINKVTDFPAVVRGLANYQKATEQAVRLGIKSPTMDFDRWWGMSRPDVTMDNYEKLAKLFYNYGGKGVQEGVTHGLLTGVFEQVAKNRALEAIGGDKSAQRWLKTAGTLVDPTKIANPETLTQEDFWQMAANLTMKHQGTYGGEGLPIGVMNSGIADILKLQRWGIEKSNEIYKSVVKPIYQDGDVRPLFAYALASVFSGEALRTIVETLFGRVYQSPNIKELVAMPSVKGAASHVADLIGLASLGGMLGTYLQTGIHALADKNVAIRGLNVPFADYVSTVVAPNFAAYAQEIQTSDNPLATTSELILNLVLGAVQNFRYLANATINSDTSKRRQETRDLRVYKLLSGGDLPFQFHAGVPSYRTSLAKRFENAESEAEAIPLARQLRTNISNRYPGDPLAQKRAYQGLRAVPDNTMPNPMTDPKAYSQFVEFIKKTQGEVEGERRNRAYIQKRGLVKAKGDMLPR